jgi:hypothetical protein
MKGLTQQDSHPYHHVFVGNDGKYATLAILNGDGEGGYDHWKIDMVGFNRVHEIASGSVMQDYWQDYVDLTVIQKIYEVLDFYVKQEDNVVGINDFQFDGSYCSDDVPF